MDGRALRKPAHKLVEELLGADLEMERVAAVLDANIEELEAVSGIQAFSKGMCLHSRLVVRRWDCGGSRS